VDVHDHHVRPQLLDHVDRLLAVAGGTDDLQLGVALAQRDQQVATRDRILRDQHPDHQDS
jgi:hypothetical protein